MFLAFCISIGMQFIQGGCRDSTMTQASCKRLTRKLVPGNQGHGVRCCSKDGTSCTTPRQCHMGANYLEAANICSKLDMRLCNDGDDLDNLCCKTGCNLDYRTIWIDGEGQILFAYDHVNMIRYAYDLSSLNRCDGNVLLSFSMS